MSAHTPGPWVLGTYDHVTYQLHGPHGRKHIAIIDNEHDARLIARAPDLLTENERLREALAECVTDQNAHCLQHQEVPGAMARRLAAITDIARAALAKVQQ